MLLLCITFISCGSRKQEAEELEAPEITVDFSNMDLPTFLPPLDFESFLVENNTISIEKWSFPLPEKYKGIISSGDGLRNSVIDVNSGGAIVNASYHNAFDIPVPEGTPVTAAKSGYVKNVYPGRWNGPQWKGHPVYGGFIEIVHYDNTKSTYAHLAETDVTQGTYVVRGQQIGLSGGAKGKRASGNSTGPHLHFTVMLNLTSFME